MNRLCRNWDEETAMNEEAKNRNIYYRSNTPAAIPEKVQNMLGNCEFGNYKHLNLKTKELKLKMDVYGS